MKRITLVLDDDDANAVAAALVERMLNPQTPTGHPLLPSGDSNFVGALMGEICRAFVDYRNEEPRSA